MTPEEFTKHVGAETFAEAVSVTLRTKASDEDTIEAQHNKIKELAKEQDVLRAKLQAAATLADNRGRAYGVHTRTAWAVVRRKSWVHIA